MKILLLSFLLSSPAAAAQAPFVYLLERPWYTLDPANAYDSVSFLSVGNIYESLISFKSIDETDAFEPALASAVPTPSADGRRYAFAIRKGVRFHDGAELTPEDARYSLLRFMLLDPEGGPAALLLRPILGRSSTRGPDGKLALSFKEAADAVRVEGESLVVTLKRADRTFLKALASLPIIVSKRWAVRRGDWDGSEKGYKKLNGRPMHESPLREAANGTGPYKLESADEDAGRLALARHAGYWRAPAALEKVVLKAEADAGLRLFLLEAGDADSGQLGPEHRPFCSKTRGVRLFDGPSPRQLGETFFLTYRVDAQDNELLGSGRLDGGGIPSDLFSDADARKGLALAFDYERYFKQGCAGRGRHATGPFPESLADSGLAPAAQDLNAATAHFKKALGGKLWENGFLLPIAYSAENAQRRLAAELMGLSLQKINPLFRVRLVPLPSKEFYLNLEDRKLPLYLDNFYGDYPDAHSFAFGLLGSGGYFPRFQGYASAEADALIDKAAALGAGPERAAAFQRLAAIAREDAHQIYTCVPEEFKACREGVLGCDSRQNANNLNFNNFPYFYALSRE